MEQLIVFVILGTIGGLLRVLLHTESLSEALEYDKSRCILIGSIMGLAYYFLHTDYNFPNGFMAIVAGYAGVDFIDAGSRKLDRILKELLKP